MQTRRFKRNTYNFLTRSIDFYLKSMCDTSVEKFQINKIHSFFFYTRRLAVNAYTKNTEYQNHSINDYFIRTEIRNCFYTNSERDIV